MCIGWTLPAACFHPALLFLPLPPAFLGCDILTHSHSTVAGAGSWCVNSFAASHDCPTSVLAPKMGMLPLREACAEAADGPSTLSVLWRSVIA